MISLAFIKGAINSGVMWVDKGLLSHEHCYCLKQSQGNAGLAPACKM